MSAAAAAAAGYQGQTCSFPRILEKQRGKMFNSHVRASAHEIWVFPFPWVFPIGYFPFPDTLIIKSWLKPSNVLRVSASRIITSGVYCTIAPESGYSYRISNGLRECMSV